MAITNNENENSPQQSPSPGQSSPLQADDLKMSAVILTLAEPLLKKYGTDAKRAESIIALAIAAWNKAMLPAEAQDGFDKSVIDIAVPSDGSAESVGVVIEVMELIEDRRKKLFPKLRVVIANYDLQVSQGRLTLNVGSAPIPASG
jgi:hypothetical protein